MAVLEPKRERDLRIDFFRGIALLLIFIDHVPDNPLAFYTLKNFGFADASEVFVLLAGFSAALAYGFGRTGGFEGTRQRAFRRAGEIYVWHLGILVVSAVMLYSAAYIFSRPTYVDHIMLRQLTTAPWQAIPGTLALVYQPNLMNILPMYVLLMLWLPVVLLMLHRSVALALGVSISLWAIVSFFKFNLPANGPNGGWYFNPLAWQLLFTAGAAAAVMTAQKGLYVNRWLMAVAAAFVLFSFLRAAPWTLWFGWDPLFPRNIVGPVSKHYLSIWRLGHILALAYLVACLLPSNAAWLRRSWAQVVATCGKHSLEIFAFGTVLSFAGGIVFRELGRSWPTITAVNIIGVGSLLWLAMYLSRRKQQKRVAAAPVRMQTSRTPLAVVTPAE